MVKWEQLPVGCVKMFLRVGAQEDGGEPHRKHINEGGQTSNIKG